MDQLLHRAAQKNWDIAKLEGILSNSDIDLTNSRIMLQFWSNDREKVSGAQYVSEMISLFSPTRPPCSQIHTSLARASTFNNHLNDFSWRVDVQTASKNSPEINIPIAVVEFGLEAGYPAAAGAGGSTVRFGMDRDEVAAVIDQLEKVQKAVDSATS